MIPSFLAYWKDTYKKYHTSAHMLPQFVDHLGKNEKVFRGIKDYQLTTGDQGTKDIYELLRRGIKDQDEVKYPQKNTA